MSSQTIGLIEALRLCAEHGIATASRGSLESWSSQWVILKNGWRLDWELESDGPYSEVTPDVDVSLNISLTKLVPVPPSTSEDI